MYIPFFRPLIDEKEQNLIKEAFINNNLNLQNEFENKIKNFFNAKYAIATTNGTSAMHLALCAMDIKRGDKFICSVNAFANVPEVIRNFDAEPIFVDIDEESFNICPKSFEKALQTYNNKKLRGAFITHVAGNSAKMDEIYYLAKKYNIKIIDDASRAMGAKFGDKLIGNLDSFISCFQINPQNQDALATAGFFVTNDDEIAKQAKLLRNHAIVQDYFDKDGNLGYIYDVVNIGVKYDLNAICAAFAIAQFEKTPSFIQRRKQIAKIYFENLKDCPHITLPQSSENHIFTQFIIKIDKNRDGFARNLREKGIATSLHYIPLHLLSYYKNKYKYKVNDFPVALRNYQQILSLPIYAAMSDKEVNYVCENIIKIAKNRV